MVDIESIGFDQYPVNRRELDPLGRRQALDPGTLTLADLYHRIGQRKGGDLHRIVANPPSRLEYPFQIPVAKNLIAY
jgi:hypothetical protein